MDKHKTEQGEKSLKNMLETLYGRTVSEAEVEEFKRNISTFFELLNHWNERE